MTEKLILYIDPNFTSPYAMSVYVSLIEKKIPFELKKNSLLEQENQRTAHWDYCQVPTLAHGHFTLFESSAIDEYLEEAFSPPHYQALYPLDIYARARARQMQAWLRSDLNTLRLERPTTMVFKACIPTPLSEAAKREAEQLFCIAESLLPLHQTNLFEQWSIADTDLAFMLNRLVMSGEHVPPRLQEYALLQWQRPSVRAWVQLGQQV